MRRLCLAHRSTIRARATVATVAIVACAQGVWAQTVTGAPVTINSCGPLLNQNQNQNQPPSLTDLLASKSSGIRIEFVNESAKTADLVNFAVDSNGERFVIRDVGTFSPGVSIQHNYRNGAGQAFVLPAFIAPNVTCSVASVKFTDGTAWRRDRPATVTTQPATPGKTTLSANPARLDIEGIGDSELFFVSSSEPITAYHESDSCAGIATVFVAATGRSTATYSVKPLAAGSCTTTITDEAGTTLSVPIIVRT